MVGAGLASWMRAIELRKSVLLQHRTLEDREKDVH
jgi:hypothetical protein